MARTLISALRRRLQPGSSRSCGRSQAGSTMIEVITVIAMTTVVVSVAVMKSTNSQDTVKARLASNQIVGAIRYAQELAMSSGTEVKVHIDPATNAYSLKWASGEFLKKPVSGGDYVINLGSSGNGKSKLVATALEQGVLTITTTGLPEDDGQSGGSIDVATLLNGDEVRMSRTTGRVYLETQ